MKIEEINNWVIERLAHDHMDMVCAFSCGEWDRYKGLDEYIHRHALNDSNGVSYIVYDKTKPDANGAAIAMFTLSCSAIMVSKQDSPPYLMPAVEVKIFALDQKYQHIRFDDADAIGTLGDFILSTALGIVRRGTKTVFGAENVVLYANDENSQSFYGRNGFSPFNTDMLHNGHPFVRGCIPMYLVLR